MTAAVAIGLYGGPQTSRLTTRPARMQGNAVWGILVFLLNSLLFVLIGLQLPRSSTASRRRPPTRRS